MVKPLLRNHSALVALIGAAFACADANAQTEPRPRITPVVDTSNGSTIVTVNLPPGALRIYLPDDIRAGDTISGSVVGEPAGATPAQRAQNGDTLSGYVLEVADNNNSRTQSFDFRPPTPDLTVVRPSNPFFRFVAAAVGAAPLIIRDRAGDILVQSGFMVGPDVQGMAAAGPAGAQAVNVTAPATQAVVPGAQDAAAPGAGAQRVPGNTGAPAPAGALAPAQPVNIAIAGTQGAAAGPAAPPPPPPRTPQFPPGHVTAPQPSTLADAATADAIRAGLERQLVLGLPTATPGELIFPRVAQAGRPIQITGPFDGDSLTTGVRINDNPIPVLAESPRAIVADVPRFAWPPNSQLTVTEGARQTARNIRIVDLQLSAPKTNLLRGESTTVTIQVQGLQGLAENVPLTLHNPTPQIVQVAGGNLQTVNIQPGDVSAQGLYTTTRSITGQQAGNFTMTASLVTTTGPIKEDPLVPGAFDMNGIDSAKELLALISSMNDEERQRRLCATVRAVRERIAGATGGTRDWLNNKLTMVLSVNETLGITCP